jgi:hypothetical protein
MVEVAIAAHMDMDRPASMVSAVPGCKAATALPFTVVMEAFTAEEVGSMGAVVGIAD